MYSSSLHWRLQAGDMIKVSTSCSMIRSFDIAGYIAMNLPGVSALQRKRPSLPATASKRFGCCTRPWARSLA